MNKPSRIKQLLPGQQFTLVKLYGVQARFFDQLVQSFES